jgi:hypothetical protein
MRDDVRRQHRKSAEFQFMHRVSPITRWLLVALSGLLCVSVQAEVPSFDDFFTGVSECRLDMTRYGGVVEHRQDGVLISLPAAGAVRGILVEGFYLAPGGADTPGRYGLLFNGPVDMVAQAFPEFAGRHTVNGHLRRLASLAEETGGNGARRKTLLVCIPGTAT